MNIQIVYKIKKQVNFGRVLEFSTLGLRRQYCYKEVELNRKLCKDTYHGVVITVPDKNNNKIVIAAHCFGVQNG
jgi:aminoglycoside phosphotransferase family enzyme